MERVANKPPTLGERSNRCACERPGKKRWSPWTKGDVYWSLGFTSPNVGTKAFLLVTMGEVECTLEKTSVEWEEKE